MNKPVTFGDLFIITTVFGVVVICTVFICKLWYKKTKQ